MKNLTIAGNIGKSAELRSTGNGEKVAGFTVAVDDGFGQNKRTLWFDVSIWGKRAETLAPMLTKGGKVCVTGDMSTREYDGKTYLTLRANDVTLQGGGQRQDDTGGGYSAPPSGGVPGLDDDLPFAPQVL
jgi:single-strand DNA-binding protein